MSDVSDTLEAIRRVELEMARRLDAVREDADQAIARANRDATDRVASARRRGRETARRKYADAVAEADENARHIIAEGDARAEQVAVDAAPFLDEAAASMMELLLAPPLEEGK